MKRTTREIINQSQAETSAINHHLAVLPRLTETLKEFNGKVVNVRLFNALSDASTCRIYKTVPYNGSGLNLMIRYDKGLTINGERTYYAQWYRECSIPLAFQECGKRLDASATIDNINLEISRLLDKLHTFDASEINIYSVHEQLDALKVQISKLIAQQKNPFLKDSLRQSIKYI